MIDRRVQMLAERRLAQRQPRHLAVDAVGNRRAPEEQRAGDHRLVRGLRQQPCGGDADAQRQKGGMIRRQPETQQHVAAKAADLPVDMTRQPAVGRFPGRAQQTPRGSSSCRRCRDVERRAVGQLPRHRSRFDGAQGSPAPDNRRSRGVPREMPDAVGRRQRRDQCRSNDDAGGDAERRNHPVARVLRGGELSQPLHDARVSFAGAQSEKPRARLVGDDAKNRRRHDRRQRVSVTQRSEPVQHAVTVVSVYCSDAAARGIGGYGPGRSRAGVGRGGGSRGTSAG